jgi:CRP-like cAMP-binding protein/anti-anti-sigma regulatory factor
VIRRQHRCDELTSKRVRPAADAAILRRAGARARVLELEGVLFFGNADDLSRVVRDLFLQCDSAVLDLRAISDIDASGANILQGMVQSSRTGGKSLLFCNVPAALRALLGGLAAGGGAPLVFPDLDTALEWLEERVLRSHAAERGMGEALTIWTHPLLEGFDAAERDALGARLVQRRFAAGSTLCAQGEPADRMWLLTRGSVSVRVRAADREAGLRVSSCAAGTAVGEMALLQFGLRSASVLADEEVEAYELSCESFEWLSRTQPQAAAKILKNIATELSRRLRERTEDLRHALT